MPPTPYFTTREFIRRATEDHGCRLEWIEIGDYLPTSKPVRYVTRTVGGEDLEAIVPDEPTLSRKTLRTMVEDLDLPIAAFDLTEDDY